MSEENADTGGGNTPSPEVQARALGWKPKEEYSGKAENWVPADKYLERGETVLPYMQADRKRLFKKVDDQGVEIARLSTALAESTEAINTLKQFTSSDALKKKDEEIVDLRRQLVTARRGGEVDVEVDLETKLDTAKGERATLAEQARTKPAGNGNGSGEGNGADPARARIQNMAQSPEFRQFLVDNPWYDTDPVARAAATAISGEIMQDPENRGLSFADKLAIVAEQTKSRMGIGEAPTRRRTKVEGSRGGGGGGDRRSVEPSYEALSPEAKAVCDRQAKTVVGANRAYKTVEDWQKAYAKMVS